LLVSLVEYETSSLSKEGDIHLETKVYQGRVVILVVVRSLNYGWKEHFYLDILNYLCTRSSPKIDRIRQRQTSKTLG